MVSRCLCACAAVALGWCCALPAVLPAQQTAAGEPPAQTPYALELNSRLVIEDVTVLDRKGQPILGLPQSAFHVVDEGKPQTIRSLTETRNDASAAAEPPAPRPGSGTFSNAPLLNNHGSVLVLLIDPSTMTLEDQMYLRLQATRFVRNVSAQTRMTVFRVNNSGIPVLLQPLTNDHAQLQAAIAAAVPIITRPTDSPLRDAVTELNNISQYLRAVPGRKAVLWLAGAFPLYHDPDHGGLCEDAVTTCGVRGGGVTERSYRALEQARVTVYPVDVRGVQMGGLTAVNVLDRGPGVTPGSVGAKPTSETERAVGQYDEMDRLADATGGRAFYSDNGVAAILQEATDLASDSHTLSYRPAGGAEIADGKWHKVSIRVDGPYTAHYRAGYYAPLATVARAAGEVQPPASGVGSQPGAAGANTAGTAAPPAVAEPSAAAQPLVFSAHVVSEGRAGKTTEVKVRYVIPSNQLMFETEPAGHAQFRLAALAYNANGDVLSKSFETVDTHYSAAQMKLASSIGTPADQTIEVARGAQYLLLAVEDLRTEKVGTVQLPLRQVSVEANPVGSGTSGATPPAAR